jgi:hypothetical protein
MTQNVKYILIALAALAVGFFAAKHYHETKK